MIWIASTLFGSATALGDCSGTANIAAEFENFIVPILASA